MRVLLEKQRPLAALRLYFPSIAIIQYVTARVLFEKVLKPLAKAPLSPTVDSQPFQ